MELATRLFRRASQPNTKALHTFFGQTDATQGGLQPWGNGPMSTIFLLSRQQQFKNYSENYVFCGEAAQTTFALKGSREFYSILIKSSQNIFNKFVLLFFFISFVKSNFLFKIRLSSILEIKRYNWLCHKNFLYLYLEKIVLSNCRTAESRESRGCKIRAVQMQTEALCKVLPLQSTTHRLSCAPVPRDEWWATALLSFKEKFWKIIEIHMYSSTSMKM